MTHRSNLIRFLTLALVILTTAALGFAQTPDEAAQAPDVSALNASSTFRNAVDAYIYGYPLLVFGTTERLGITVPYAGFQLGAAPLNQFGKEEVLPNSSFTGVVLPSTTTLYASAFINLASPVAPPPGQKPSGALEAAPVVLHIPNISNRFFLLQMLDGWTNVSEKSPGTRLDSKEGDYLLAGPDWHGDLPPSIPPQNVIQMDTNSMWIIGRFYTNGTDADIKDVVQTIYPSLTLTPLSAYIKGQPYTAPTNLPVDPSIETVTQPVRQVDGMDACTFFGTLASMMKFNQPILPQDQAIVDKLAEIGITKDKSFDCTTLRTPEGRSTLAALQLAVVTARNILPSLQQPPGPNTNFWTLSLGVGEYGTNYLLRAEVALNALGANNPIDAVYGYGTLDDSGNTLDGSHQYVLHFNPKTAAKKSGEIPPVNPKAFWSVTIYDRNGFLVANDTVNYNAIGIPEVQGHEASFNADNSLDLYLQADPPSGAAFQNWLPIPSSGPFIVFLRMYWPDAVVVKGNYIPPAIRKVQ